PCLCSCWDWPFLVGALPVALLSFSLRLPLHEGAPTLGAPAPNSKAKLPARFWAFAAFALLYGICETINGNWASLYMTHNLGASTPLASLALTIFWGTVTAGRMVFAAIGRWFPEHRTCRVLPFIVGAALLITAFLPKGNPYLGIVAFALAGLGCSALLPLTISFGEKELTAIAAAVAGGLIAFYQIGYGIAAFGVGPLQTRVGLGLNAIYGGTALVAAVVGAVSVFVCLA